MNRNLDFSPNFGRGQVYLDFSYTANGASNPVISGASSTSRGGLPDSVLSIVRSGVGIHQVTMKAGASGAACRYIINKFADIEDLDASDDGAYASAGPDTNDGTGTAATFKIYTRAAAGTKTDYTGRRINVTIVFKNSVVGV